MLAFYIELSKNSSSTQIRKSEVRRSRPSSRASRTARAKYRKSDLVARRRNDPGAHYNTYLRRIFVFWTTGRFIGTSVVNGRPAKVTAKHRYSEDRT